MAWKSATENRVQCAAKMKMKRNPREYLPSARGRQHNGTTPSGDAFLFLAFSTANGIPVQTVTASGRSVATDPWKGRLMPMEVTVFEGTADAVEEAISSVLCMHIPPIAAHFLEEMCCTCP
ncbi:hypothetical protein C8R43DRAFT_964079 [Mycena crocata]|nr:hypothetical protein C8R43DRAFT_964079 [Mycena crocata]